MLLYSSGGGCNLAMLGWFVPVVGWVVAAKDGRCYPSDPPKAIARVPDVRAIAAGNDFVTVLRMDGTVAWRGVNDDRLHSRPLEGIAQIVAERTFACARSTAGAVHCWGSIAQVPLALGPHGSLRDVPLE